jgi:hypothetical protein
MQKSTTTTEIDKKPLVVNTTDSEPKKPALKGRQGHGKVYEEDIIRRFKYTPYTSYTHQFDAEKREEIRNSWFNIAKKGTTRVSIKVTKQGRGAIDLGDLSRIASITEPFIFHLGIYTGDKENMHMVEEIGVKIDPKTWKKYIGPVSVIESARKELKDIPVDKNDAGYASKWKEFRERNMEKYNSPTKFNQVINSLLNREHKEPIVKMAPKRNSANPDKLDKNGNPFKGAKRIQGRISLNDFMNHVMVDNKDGIFYHTKNGKNILPKK